MVGVTGLEPATSRPPAVRASQLRHTPPIQRPSRTDVINLARTKWVIAHDGHGHHKY